MNKVLFIVILISTMVLSCSKEQDKSVFIATCPPVAFILQEIAGDRTEIVNLLKAGESPHTFSPSPSTVRQSENALAVFYVSPYLDEWAANLPNRNIVKLIDKLDKKQIRYFTEETNTQIADPHFFTDPIAIESIIPEIVKEMSAADPANMEYYADNGRKFSEKLRKIDLRIRELTEPLKGKKVVLFHPSFVYFIKRYGLEYSGSVEPVPGKEPSPAYLTNFTEKLKKENINVVFSETELPEGPAMALAEALNAKVFQLDPLGGIKGRNNIEEYLLYNTKIFLEALK